MNVVFKKIILASNNTGKLKELQSLLAPLGLELLSQKDFSLPSIEETGLSFVENAILKARYVAKETGLPAIADDSGLCVDVLGGAPGIYSARFAGEDATDALNNQKLLKELTDVEDEKRGAHFRCALALVRHAEDPIPIICEGVWLGRILHEAVGDQGFGYDPLFFIPEKNCASAELDKENKNKLSHRGLAIKDLLKKIQEEF